MGEQLIELWETYLLQLDSDEDGPPLMPAGVHADPAQKSDAQLRREAAKAQLEAEAAAESPRVERPPSLSGTTAHEDEPRASEDTLHEEGSRRAGGEEVET